MQRLLTLLLLLCAAPTVRAEGSSGAPGDGSASDENSRRAVVGQMLLDFHSRALPFDREEWWLSGRVPTRNGKVPASARPVWIQFGFKGCKPCEALAAVAVRELPDAEKVYVHLDNLLLGSDEYPNKPALWRALAAYASAAPYDTFTVLYGNGEPLLHAMCGEGAAVPSAILVAADGRVVSVLNSPSESEAVAAMAQVANR